MDKAKAIEVLKPLANSYVDYANITMKEEDDDIAEALEMAIDVLRQPEPSTSCSEFPNNSDSVSRQAAIDLFPNDVLEWDTLNGYIAPHVARRLIEQLPPAQTEPKWIPVERELPEPRIDVWVNSDLGQMVGYYDEMVELWYGRDYLELIVNAWMPLPTPYQKGATP